jgi:flagellar protein FliS
MSYGSFANNAARYRDMEVSSATPGQLVVILYDHLLTHLAKARHAMGPDQIGPRSDALSVCRTVVTELLVTLDRQRGGDVAVQLGAIYSFVLGELTTLGLRPDATRLERITNIMQELRDAFAQVALTAPAPLGKALSVA